MQEIWPGKKTVCVARQKYHFCYGRKLIPCIHSELVTVVEKAYWAVVHGKGESTNVHDHASGENYQAGAKVSAAFYVSVPKDSGDLVFQYQRNPYLVEHQTEVAEEGKFVLFDSCLPHFVTKNLSDELRIVISMNFRYPGDGGE